MKIKLKLLVPFFLTTAHASAKSVSPGELLRWKQAGIGEATISGEQLILSEGSHSQGMMLISPEKYTDKTILSFRVRPKRFEGVLVVVLSASSVDGSSDLPIPEDYDGNWNFWKSSDSPVQSYAFAFHTGYHQPFSFVRKNPGYLTMPEGSARHDVVTEERWYHIEIGRSYGHLWMKVDGESVLDTVDTSASIPGGHLAFRVRGPGDGSFSASYKDIHISTPE